MGDHMMVAFEWDSCVFRKLYGWNPIVTDPDLMEASGAAQLFQNQNGYYPIQNQESNRKATTTIRRMILDSFWSRASSTVESNVKVIQRRCVLSTSSGLEPPYPEPGPPPSFDHCGYGAAIQMLLALQELGRRSSVYKQFDTSRRFKTAYGNQVRAVAQANSEVTSIRDADGKSDQ
jgi:hypothetical protein